MLIGRVGPALELRYGLAVLLGFFFCLVLRHVRHFAVPIVRPSTAHSFYCECLRKQLPQPPQPFWLMAQQGLRSPLCVACVLAHMPTRATLAEPAEDDMGDGGEAGTVRRRRDRRLRQWLVHEF